MNGAKALIGETLLLRPRSVRWRIVFAALAMVASVLAVAAALPVSAATVPNGHMTLNGGDYMVAPNFSSGTSDMDFIFHAAADDWSAGRTQAVVGHWGQTRDSRAVRVHFTKDGSLQLVFIDKNGKAHVYSAWAGQLGLRDGRGYWFRIRFNAAVGSESRAKFFVSGQDITTPPGKVRWAEKRMDTGPVARPRNTGAKWTIGAASGGVDDRFKGDIAWVGFWRNGWRGNGGDQAIQLDMRTTKQATNSARSQWFETARTWTAKGSGWKYNPPTSGGTTTTTKPPATTTKPPATTTTTRPPTTTTTVAPPTGYDVIIRPGDNIASIVANKPAGTSFFIKAGKYRLQEIRVKDNMKFVGESGAVLSGAKKLTSFTRSSGLWVASGQTQGSSSRSQGSEWGYCDSTSNGMCVFPEQLFVGGKLQTQVKYKSQVTAGKWFFDYGADKIYFGTDPTGKTVETSVKKYAFWGNSDNVVIRGLTMEKYATPGRQGVINPRIGRTGSNGVNWTVRNNVIRDSHAIAIKMESGFDVIGNTITRMGQIGINGSNSSNLLVANNDVSRTCIEGYKCFGWAGGPLKFDDVRNITIRNNHVHDNKTHGIHTDGRSYNVIIEDNVVRNNAGTGIEHEISGLAKIRNNIVEYNGSRDNGQWGILVLSSRDTEVYGNKLKGNKNGIMGRQDGRTGVEKLTNLWVHHNTIELNGKARMGFSVSGSDTSYFTSRNNRFNYNTYTMKHDSSTFKPFNWIGGLVSVSTWKSKGQDTSSTFR